jgi:hypothetical protein
MKQDHTEETVKHSDAQQNTGTTGCGFRWESAGVAIVV